MNSYDAKSWIRVLVLSTLVIGLSACAPEPENADLSSGDTVSLTTTIIPVEGVACMACAARINRHLGALDGIESVETTLAPPQVIATFDASLIQEKEITGAVQSLGYRAGKPQMKNDH